MSAADEPANALQRRHAEFKHGDISSHLTLFRAHLTLGELGR